MALDRTVRRLTALKNAASSARVLNLLATHRRFPDDAELIANPMFCNRSLNRSIILKHRLRPNEYDLFDERPTTVTKILLPIDGGDLRAGARSVRIGQNGYESMLEDAFGRDLKAGGRDRAVLDLIDALPSLDPFLLREQLRHQHFTPAAAYFAMADADLQRMTAFLRRDVQALAALSAGRHLSPEESASRLVERLLSAAPEQVFEPLRDILGLADKTYADGVFAWRGFLYYKWLLSTLERPMETAMGEIAAIQGRGRKTNEAAAFLSGAKRRIQTKLMQAHGQARELLAVYDEAYQALTARGDPAGFRNFLRSAPDSFVELGEQLGAIEHVVRFWAHRMPKGQPDLITIEELTDLFVDFEDGLSAIPEDMVA